ncbi:MAG TPA: hypothetical protein VGP04_21400 [Pseudonocardiaceae bacterium]|nr:hypothetical protein [Pseudonocardiaceae bacterium]
MRSTDSTERVAYLNYLLTQPYEFSGPETLDPLEQAEALQAVPHPSDDRPSSRGSAHRRNSPVATRSLDAWQGPG